MTDVILTQFKELFKQIINEAMKEERENYLKTHDTQANGFYTRNPKTLFGEMDIEVPRTRDGSFKPSLLPPRKRFLFSLDKLIIALFEAGVTTRKTVKVIENLTGFSPSPSYVSQATKIAIEEIEKWKTRAITKEYPVIYLDATYLPLKRDTVAKEAVYVVLGVAEDDGRRACKCLERCPG